MEDRHRKVPRSACACESTKALNRDRDMAGEGARTGGLLVLIRVREKIRSRRSPRMAPVHHREPDRDRLGGSA
jgi:hypothetical protein